MVRERRNGFTMIEVLVAVVILAMAMSAMASLQVTAIRGNSAGNSRGVAVQIINAKLNELRSYPYYYDLSTNTYWPDPGKSFATIIDAGEYTEAYTTEGVPRSELIQRSGYDPSDENYKYTLTWSIVDTGDSQSEMDAGKAVTIEISWKDESGTERISYDTSFDLPRLVR